MKKKNLSPEELRKKKLIKEFNRSRGGTRQGDMILNPFHYYEYSKDFVKNAPKPYLNMSVDGSSYLNLGKDGIEYHLSSSGPWKYDRSRMIASSDFPDIVRKAKKSESEREEYDKRLAPSIQNLREIQNDKFFKRLFKSGKAKKQILNSLSREELEYLLKWRNKKLDEYKEDPYKAQTVVTHF